MNNRIYLAQRRKDAKVIWNTRRLERETNYCGKGIYIAPAPCIANAARPQSLFFYKHPLRAFAPLREIPSCRGDS